MIVHAIDGRVRIRHKTLEKSELVGDLMERMQKAKGILQVDLNEISGSLLIHYDPVKTTLDEIKKMLPPSLYSEAQSKITYQTHSRQKQAKNNERQSRGKPNRSNGVPKVVDITQWRKKASDRLSTNQLAKGGMLASLSASLLFVIAGKKGYHILNGLAFLAFLQLHLSKHGKRLFS